MVRINFIAMVKSNWAAFIRSLPLFKYFLEKFFKKAFKENRSLGKDTL